MSGWFARIFGPPPPAAVNRIIRGCATDIDQKPDMAVPREFFLPPGYSGKDKLAVRNIEAEGTTPAFSDLSVFKLEAFLNIVSLDDVIVTLRKNGVDTLATVTVTAGATYAQIILGSNIGFVETDLWTLRISQSPGLIDSGRRNVFANLHAEII